MFSRNVHTLAYSELEGNQVGRVNSVVLFVVDGLRPDGLQKAKTPLFIELADMAITASGILIEYAKGLDLG